MLDADSGEPVIGAYLVDSRNQNNYVMTDIDGRFKITIRDRRTSLTVSMIGYQTQNVDVTNIGEITIRLVSDNLLEESVVVGAGTQKRVSITGAIASVDGEILKMPTSSLTSSLAGKLAGVIQMNNSGAPGSTSEFYIRGIGTFGGRSTPLILLDDVEISSGDLKRIPPETIKS